MDDDALASLAESIRQHGVIQPILVTETIDGYQLVAGERRIRAARMAGLERIPAIVRQLADRAAARARARREPPARGSRPDRGGARLPPAASRSSRSRQEDLATRVGRARSTVANTLRLLELHRSVQDAIVDGPDHARATRARSAACRSRRQARVARHGRSTRGCPFARPRSSCAAFASRGTRKERTPQPPDRRPGGRARRGGPAPVAGHEGSADPDAARRPDRDRVLRRRRARPDLPAADWRDRVTEPRTRRPARLRGRRRRRKRPQRRERRRRRSARRPAPTTPPPASRSSRASRPSASARACTSARRTSAACTSSSGRSSTTRSTRRWPATPSNIQVTIDADGTRRGHRRRPRRPGRQARDRQGRARGRAHGAARRRQVRRRRLQGLRRPARRRDQRRERAVGVAARRDGTRRRHLGPGIRARQADRAGQEDRPAGRPARHADRSGPTREMFETTEYSFETISQRLRESAYLTKGVWITLHRRARRSRALVLLRGRPPVVRPAPEPEQGGAPHTADLRRATRGRDDGRGGAPVQRHVHRERPRLREQHQHGRWRHPRHGLPRRADELAERLGAQGGRSQGRRTATSRATTCARA